MGSGRYELCIMSCALANQSTVVWDRMKVCVRYQLDRMKASVRYELCSG